MKHRGRIQAQGKNTEKSEAWSQNEPPTKNDGIDMLDNLKNKMSKIEVKIRDQTFIKAIRFINNGPYKVVDKMISKTFMVSGSNQERIDIEIRKGIAFTIDKSYKND